MSPTTTPSAEPNLTPMIDVLLVLLIVFMVSIARVHHTVDVQLPRACTLDCRSDGETIVLEVFRGPAYRINGTVVLEGELLARLRDIYAERPEKVIDVAGHEGVSYETVVTAMDVARTAGVRVIGIAPRELSEAR